MFQEENATLQTVGDSFGLTRERVRQILKKNGINDRNKWSIVNSGAREEALKLYAVGIPLNDIDRTFGVSRQSLLGPIPRTIQKQRRISQFWQSAAVTADASKCWLWIGCTHPNGYGLTTLFGKQIYAHRAAFQIANGEAAKQWVLHTCDVPGCINPAHLYDGTPQDNVRDRDARSRGAFAKGTWRRLTNAQVAEIRQLLADGVSQSRIAKRMNTTPTTINNINTGRSRSGRPRTKADQFVSKKTIEIRRRLQAGESGYAIAKDMGMNEAHVYRLRKEMLALKNLS